MALGEARKGRWHACPNPTVGAVLIKDGRIVACGYHHKAGQPHAEIECLNDARQKGISPAGCTIVVTLEPCNHTGRTGPCSEALIQAGVGQVVIGMRDPNPVAGGGAEHLRAAGIPVVEGILARECQDSVADFVTWTVKKRPFVLLKLAATLDGRIATRSGQSRWITSEASRAEVHALRAGIGLAGGAVLVGGRTFRRDNPLLTARTTPSATRQPLACILTSRLPGAQDDFHLLRERPGETIFFVPPAVAASPRAVALQDAGVGIVPIETASNGHADLASLLELLWAKDCRYVLCEGGGALGLSLLEQQLADLFFLHLAPKILGDNAARPLFDGRSPLEMADALDLRLSDVRVLGGDVHLTLFPTAHD